MKIVEGFYLPDGEEHLGQFLKDGPEFAGGPTYQLRKLMQCMPHIRNFRRAVDVGAHCGLWTRVLAQMFRWVDAFEPMPDHVECFEENLAGKIFPDASPPGAVVLHTQALGAAAQKVRLRTDPTSSGDTYVSDEGVLVRMIQMDSLGLTDVDFIKIDCEGYESYVLQGSEQTIRKQKPFVIVEQKPGKGKQHGLVDDAACRLLEKWGAKRMFEISGDYGYRFP
jgi:FkbM family methyltransferase